MQDNVLCAPAGSALIRDVRCWHGGTENRSQIVRPMVSTGYYAPWFMRHQLPVVSAEHWDTLSDRQRELLRYIGPAR